jgi:hypothetical protein
MSSLPFLIIPQMGKAMVDVHTSWPLLLVAVGFSLFLLYRPTLGSWITCGIGAILFVVYLVVASFPGSKPGAIWSDPSP